MEEMHLSRKNHLFNSAIQSLLNSMQADIFWSWKITSAPFPTELSIQQISHFSLCDKAQLNETSSTFLLFLGLEKKQALKH